MEHDKTSKLDWLKYENRNDINRLLAVLKGLRLNLCSAEISGVFYTVIAFGI